MKLLNVTPYAVAPRPVGGAVRITSLMSRLAVTHEVTGFSQRRDAAACAPTLSWVEISPSYHELQFSDPITSLLTRAAAGAWVRAPIFSGLALDAARPSCLIRLLRQADAVIVDYPWQFGFCRRNSRGVPVIYASHNSETAKFRSHQAIAEGRWKRTLLAAIRRMEAQAVAKADLVITVSDSDRDSLIREFGALPSKILTVPDGADTRRFRPVSLARRLDARRRLGLPDRPTVFFAGGASMPPNQVAAAWVRRIAALAPYMTFLILGAVGQPGTEGNVIITGVVDDVAPYLRASDLAVVPVEYGGGVKLKLMESLAAGLPTVAFPEALGGTHFRDGLHVLTAAKDEAAVLASLLLLLDNRELAGQLACAAREMVCECYDWDLISERFGSALGEFVSGHQARKEAASRQGRRYPGGKSGTRTADSCGSPMAT